MIGVAASERRLAHDPAQPEARLIGQHEVDEDQVGRIVERRAQRVARGRRLAARDLPVRETLADLGPDIVVFVYDQYHFGRHMVCARLSAFVTQPERNGARVKAAGRFREQSMQLGGRPAGGGPPAGRSAFCAGGASGWFVWDGMGRDEDAAHARDGACASAMSFE
jgi:hypothetical protein